jgi:flavin reductase
MRDSFVSALSNAASSVAVVTSAGEAGMAGSTVSSFCSVSADPPTLLACIHKQSALAQTIEANGRFCLNLLTQQQSRESDVFAGRIKAPDGNKFSLVDWHESDLGQPVINHSLASFDCKVSKIVDGESHWVLIGTVMKVHQGTDSVDSLIYCQRAYVTTSVLSSSVAA